MNKKSEIFERIKQFSEFKGFKTISKFSKHIGFTSPEKLYRLRRNVNSTPSYDMLVHIANKFEDLDLNWLIKGSGEMIIENNPEDEDPADKIAANPIAASISNLLQAVSEANNIALQKDIKMLLQQLHSISENEKEMKTKIDHMYKAFLKTELSEDIEKTIDKIKE